MALAVAAGFGAPAGATTLIRQSLGDLVAGHGTIVVGEVLAAESYWNAEGTFILTDVRIQAHEVLKGDPSLGEFTVTLLGGTVGDLTALIVAGAELVPGRFYALFVGDADLPGALGVPTVPEHIQGVFDLVDARDGLRAVSQGNRHPLYPDARGRIAPPGGAEGIPLEQLKKSIVELIENPQAAEEVQG
jgi:hypothetical protein